MLRISFGYPTPEEEWQVLDRRLQRRQEAQVLRTIVDARTLLGMQATVETVVVDATTSAGIALLLWLPLAAMHTFRSVRRHAGHSR